MKGRAAPPHPEIYRVPPPGSCGMPVLFSLLVAGNSYESISRVGFINNFGSDTAGLRENYLYPDNGQDYRYFLSQILGIFEASPA